MGNDLQLVLEKLGIQPKNKSIYQQAFTHRSFLNESKEALESNERLEFLGDSILSYIISAFIYQLRPQDEEGMLTNLRSHIIKTESLARSSRELNLGRFLHLSRGEESSGGRNSTQLLANTYEALLGAVYLDQGLEKANAFVHTTLLPLFEHELKFGPPKDAKSQLQEVIQNKTKASPRYKVLKTQGPDHAKQFMVGVFVNNREIGRGEGLNKQQAEEEAARKALVSITKASI